jgi:glyceraldehyde 3-phosphate dehydrogenase
MGDIDINAHLTQYDSAHGRFPAEVKVDGDCMVVNGDRIKMFSTRNPLETPWGELGIDLVLECSGKFTSKEKAMVHISQGAKKVLISAPGEKDVDATIVYGVNQQVLKPSDIVVSNASCTTNCLAPLVKPLLEKIGIESGLMTTIHAFTNDQVLTDVYHKDMRRARSAMTSITAWCKSCATGSWTATCASSRASPPTCSAMPCLCAWCRFARPSKK